MASGVKVTSGMTKKEIIEEYNRLLDEFQREAAARKDAEKRLSELEKKKDQEALDAGLTTTVDSVLEGISRLRALVGTTLNNFGDKMAEQAEKLERLTRAVELQEAKLKDLYDIESAADTMTKLAAAYAEQRKQLETEYALRQEELERTLAARKAELNQEIEETRAQWQAEKENEEEQRAREQAEYEYTRDRERRLDEDAYAEKKAALDKELQILKEEAEKEIAARKAALTQKEEEFQRMAAEIEAFPEKLEAAVQAARAEAAAEVRKEMEHNAALAKVEREWERKALEQTIAHLKEVNKSLEAELKTLTAELREARRQVNAIAEKAVEGASVGRAIESVNRITREQPRTGEKAGN